MIQNAYSNIPKKQILFRSRKFAVLGFIVGLILLDSWARNLGKTPAQLFPGPTDGGVTLDHPLDRPLDRALEHYDGLIGQAALKQWRDTVKAWTAIPSYCWPGMSVNQFQNEQCFAFWSVLVGMTLLSLIPVVVGALVWGGILFKVSLFYRKASQQIARGQGALRIQYRGVVEPDGNARFTKMHLLKEIRYEGRLEQGRPGSKSSRRIPVYFPESESLPKIGQTLLAYPMGQGKYVAVLHTPHVAVLVGSR